jgi:hypothetical protein
MKLNTASMVYIMKIILATLREPEGYQKSELSI